MKIDTVDLSALETSVHKWLSDLSATAQSQNWVVTMDGKPTIFGIGKESRQFLAQRIVENLLDETSDTPIPVRVSVWDSVFVEFCNYVKTHDFPKGITENNGKKMNLNKEGLWTWLERTHQTQLSYRLDIESVFANHLSQGLSSKHKM